MIKKIILTTCIIFTSQIHGFESAAQCMKGRLVRTVPYSVAPLQTLHISGVVFGPSISVWSLGFVKGSSDTGIICYVNGRPDGWNDNWVSYNMGSNHLKLIPMFPNEASFYGHASGGLTGSNIVMTATCIPDGASFAVFMATPGESIIPGTKVLGNLTTLIPPQNTNSPAETPETTKIISEESIEEINNNEDIKTNNDEERETLAEEYETPENINGTEPLIDGESEHKKEKEKEVDEKFEKENEENELLKFQHGFYGHENKFNSERIGDHKITEALYVQAQEVIREMTLNNPKSKIHISFFDPENTEPSKASVILNSNFKEYMLKQINSKRNKPSFKLANTVLAGKDSEASNVYNDTSQATPPKETVATKTSKTSISSGKHDSGSYRKFIKIPRRGWKQVKWSSSAAPRSPAKGHKRIDPLPGTPSRRSVGRTENMPRAKTPGKDEKFTDEIKYEKYANVEKYKYRLLRSIENYEPYEVNDVVAIRDNLNMRKGWNYPDNWFINWYDKTEWEKRIIQKSQNKIPSNEYLLQAQKAAEYIKHEIIFLENYGKIIYPHTMIIAQNILCTNSNNFYLMEENIVLTIYYKKLYEKAVRNKKSSSGGGGRGGRGSWGSLSSSNKLIEKYKRLYKQHQRYALYYLENNNNTEIDSVKEGFPLAELDEYKFILSDDIIEKIEKTAGW